MIGIESVVLHPNRRMLRRQLLRHALQFRCSGRVLEHISSKNSRLLSYKASAPTRRHVIAALVVNQPGCLAEIANLFAARGRKAQDKIKSMDSLMCHMQVITWTAWWWVEQK